MKTYVMRARLIWRLWWENFKRTMRFIGDIQARIILTVLYVILVLPTGLVLRAVIDPLHLRPPAEHPSYWIARQPLDDSLEGARLQS